MSREIILSTVSFHLPSRKETLQSNLERAHKYVEEAISRDSDICCLPEFFTVFGVEDYDKALSESLSQTKSILDGFATIAAKGKLYLIINIPEKEGEFIFNTAFLFDRNGEVIGKYRKTHLAPGEEEKIEEAELSKLLENLYRAVNIGLVNELKVVCHKLNIDVINTINIAATKNFGFQKFLPGPGLGGHCIPIDPFYLSWISKKKGYVPRFINLAGIINSKIPEWTIEQVLKKIEKSKKIKILLLGLSYKKNVDDDRESPAYEFMKIFKRKKIQYDYHDPYFDRARKGRNTNENKKSITLNKKNISKYDASILLTDHDVFDYKLIAKHSKLIFDTRGKFKEIKLKNYKNIIFC